MTESIRIEGLDKLLKKIEAEPLLAKPLRDGLTKAGILVTNEAKKNAPVDRGLLKNSITYEVDPSALPTYVKVGAKPFYAPYMEYGTGLVHDHPNWPRKRHVPPAGVLDKWAQRKGIDATGEDIANAIFKRGGLKPRRYLRNALRDNESKAIAIIKRSLKAVEEGFAN